MKKLLCIAMIAWFTMYISFGQATYQLGKVYEINGVKGLVYKLSDDRRHGKMMSITECKEKKGQLFLTDKKFDQDTKAFDMNDGKENAKAIEKFITKTNQSWAIVPMFKWAKSLGEGWYIPSANELVELMQYISGGTDGKVNMNKVSEVEKELKAADGDDLTAIVAYQKVLKIMNSSTELTESDKKGNKLFYLTLSYGGNVNLSAWKKVKAVPSFKYGTRAIKEF